MESLDMTYSNLANEQEEQKELEFWRDVNSRCCEAESMQGLGAWREADLSEYDDKRF